MTGADSRIRVLIVDDEPLARKKIQLGLKGEADVEIVGEAQDGNEAVNMIRELHPDLVFLDIQMPGLSGFEVIETVGWDRMPPVIFITAFDQYAIRAFEVRAVDYILKPVETSRLLEALGRVRERLSPPGSWPWRDEFRSLLETLGRSRSFAERLAIRDQGRTVLLPVDRIDYVESCRNYVSIHAGPETHIMRETMSALEIRLDPRQFMRIHRYFIVNVARVREIQPHFSGDQVVILTDGKRLTLSRHYRKALERLLGEAP